MKRNKMELIEQFYKVSNLEDVYTMTIKSLKIFDSLVEDIDRK